MTLTLGTLTLSDGTRAQPWRIISSTGSRNVESATRIRAANVALFDRKNKSFSDVIELTRTWDSVSACASGCISLQNEILSEPLGTLSYGSTNRGNAIATNVSMSVFGCACIFTITLEGTST